MDYPISWPGLDDFLKRAIEEDLGSGDVTTDSIIDPSVRARMEWVAKSPLTVCGLFVAGRVFELLSSRCEPLALLPEGARAEPGKTIFQVGGPARALLSGERVALNVCQRLSGIAGLTARFVEVAGGKAKIAATRKTTPGMRMLEKYAVVAGGGVPHRFGLADGVLIKDNHVVAAGSIGDAVARARSGAHHLLKIEVEVTNREEAEQALEAGADLLLLDNMSIDEMRAVAERFGGRCVLEASGNMTLERAAEVAATGVHIISVGALTHSAPAADISARLKVELGA